MFLGIDGGGTKTKFTLCDESGLIKYEYTGPTCHYLQCGLSGLTELFSDAISEVCKGVGISSRKITRIFAGCAGYGDVLADEQAIQNAVQQAFIDIPFDIGNDCENALAGALAGDCGINIIAGTGSMGCGRNIYGDIQRCGGWHHAIGSDEGSGYWLGWNLLHEFTRQSDGRDEKTALYYLLKDYLELSSDDELLTVVIDNWKLDRTKIASLAPLCSDLYDKGDSYAVEFINSAAQELFDIADALYRRLGFDKKIPVSGTGGIFKMGAKVTSSFNTLLEQNNMFFCEPRLEPDRGALILAMQNSGIVITDTILTNLAEH